MVFRRFSKIVLGLVGILVSTGICAGPTSADGELGVALRMVGHQVLLHSGDSTSRVLPVTVKDNRYTIRFESSFGFEPDNLVAITDSVMETAGFAGGYLVEVSQCTTGEVVHSFKVGNWAEDNVVPCGGRTQPEDCYTIAVTLINPASGMDSGGTNFGATWLLIPFTAIGFGLFFWKRRKPNLVPDLEPISIGTYRFDRNKATLITKDEVIELTGKEADLLDLLSSAANTTMGRDEILQKVWGDEGAYIGRTLDVFISKLRKKLSGDPAIRIANIRGVGYKLIVD